MRPCSVVTRSGECIDRIYVIAADEWLYYWGPYPDSEMTPGFVVDVRDIAEISESPYRLPAGLAEQLYRMGETGMGYYEFTLFLQDGRRIGCQTGNAVDFPPLPSDAVGADVVRVERGLANAEVTKDAPPYKVAFFEKEPGETRAPHVEWAAAVEQWSSTPEEDRRGHLSSEVDERLGVLADELRRWLDLAAAGGDSARQQADLQRFLLAEEPSFRLALEGASWMTLSDQEAGYLSRHPDLDAILPAELDLATRALDEARVGPPGPEFQQPDFSEAQIKALIRILIFARYVVDTSFLPAPGRLGDRAGRSPAS